MFLGKDVLKICRKFTGEHPCRAVILIKVQSNFIEITLRHGCSPVNLLHISRIPWTPLEGYFCKNASINEHRNQLWWSSYDCRFLVSTKVKKKRTSRSLPKMRHGNAHVITHVIIHVIIVFNKMKPRSSAEYYLICSEHFHRKNIYKKGRSYK